MIVFGYVRIMSIDGTGAVTAGDVFALATVSMLSVALPLSVIAAYGFRNAPFGAMLKPLPVTIFAFILSDAISLLGGETTGTGYLVFSSIGVGAALVATVNGILLLTERRAV